MNQVDERRRAGDEIASLSGALDRGEHALDVVPGLLKRILQEETWRAFTTPRGEDVEYERFEEFAKRPPLKGLGADVDLIKRIVQEDKETLDLLDVALQNPTGLHNIQATAPTGTSEAAALRRLRKDAPELHRQVLAGELSAHGAMREAGLRPRTITVRPDDPASTARTLHKHMTPVAIAQLRELLS